MSDKRTVATDALATLGTAPLDDTARRDAIHLAVEPVIAGEWMTPGDPITARDGVAWRAGGHNTPLGIVDPFVARNIEKGERFWMILYPRTIQSLRHVWSHPAFPDVSDVTGEAPPAILTLRKIESEQWLRRFCAEVGVKYDLVTELITNGSLPSRDPEYYNTGGRYDHESLYFEGRDAHGDIPAEFWDHVEVVLGRPVAHRPAYFSCSC